MFVLNPNFYIQKRQLSVPSTPPNPAFLQASAEKVGIPNRWLQPSPSPQLQTAPLRWWPFWHNETLVMKDVTCHYTTILVYTPAWKESYPGTVVLLTPQLRRWVHMDPLSWRSNPAPIIGSQSDSLEGKKTPQYSITMHKSVYNKIWAGFTCAMAIQVVKHGESSSNPKIAGT